MKLNKTLLLQDSLTLCVGLVLLALAFVLENPAGVEIIAALVFTGQLILLVLRHAQSRLVMLFLLFCLTYPLIFVSAKYLSVPYHYILEYQDPKLELILWANGIVFFSVFFWSINSVRSQMPLQLYTTDRSLYWGAVMASVGLILLAVASAWPPVLSGYSVESSSSSLFEYSVIPAVIAVLVAQTPKEKQLLYLLLLIGLLAPLLFARRGVSIIFFVLMFFQATKRVKNPWVIFTALFGVYFGYRVFALIRGDVAYSLASFFGAHLEGTLSNHQGGVIVSSITYLGLVNDAVWDFAFRVQSAFGVVFAPFVPSSLNPFPQVFLNLEALKVANIPGSGGFPFVYLYVWGGVIYVLLGAAAMRWVMFNTYLNPALVSAKLVVLISFPRWYAYSLPIGFKYFVMTLIIAAVLMSFRRKDTRYA